MKTKHYYKNLLFILIFLALQSCNNKTSETKYPKYDKKGKLIVYSEEEYIKMWIKNKKLDVTIVDTFCINQKERALRDIKKGKLIYFGFHHVLEPKLIKRLKKYNISYKEHLGRCTRIGGFEPYCYQEEMWKEIDKRYGENFIDSLVETVKKEYIIEHPNEEYMEDGIDLRTKYLPK